MRIACEPTSVRDQPWQVADSVERASVRALENSRTEVLDRRGAYVGVIAKAPVFTWSGAGASAVAVEDREYLEELVRHAISNAIHDAGLLADPGSMPMAAPLQDVASESPDEERAHWLFGTYAIPSYDDQGNQIEVEITESDQYPVWARPPATFFTDNSVFTETLKKSVAKFGVPNRGDLVGIIYPVAKGYQVYYWPPNQRKNFRALGFTKPSKPVAIKQGTRITWKEETFDLPVGRVQLRHISPKESVEEFREYLLARLKRTVEKLRTQTQADYEQKLDKFATAEAEKRRAAFGDKVIRITAGATVGWLPVPDDANFQFQGVMDLVPIHEMKDREDGEQGSPGKSGQGGNGDDFGGDAFGNGSGGEGAGLGSFVFTGKEGEGSGGPAFPSRQGASGTATGSCSPLLGEPSLSEFGTKVAAIEGLIRRIAFLLQIEPCHYAARFCVQAATAIGARAGGVAAHAASVHQQSFTAPINNDGNLGAVQFTPSASPAIQFMRHLALVVPDISQLARAVQALYEQHPDMVEGTWGGRPMAWNLHFLMELTPRMKDSVGFLFGMTCQVVLLQLLRSSHEAIKERLDNIERYAQNFEQVIVPQLAKIEELEFLLQKLKDYETIHGVAKVLNQAPPQLGPSAAWIEVARSIADAMKGAAQAPAGARGERGKVTVGEDGQPRVWDKGGRLWSKLGLERGIVQRRGFLEQVDPLIKQFVELDEVMDRFKDNEGGVRTEIEALLREMAQNNEEQRSKTRASWMYAFRASKIRKHLPAATVPHTSLALQGIHMRAHEQLGEFFKGDRYYAEGLNSLFHAELGRESLTSFFEFAGVMLLSVVCPPAGFAVGAGAALFHYAEALEREQLYESLIDPELVLSRAEVEAELFAARLGVALSFIPEVGSLLGKGASATARLGVKGAAGAAVRSTREFAKGGVKAASRAFANRLTKATAESLKRGVWRAIAEELATDQMMEIALNKLLIEPRIQAIMRETTVRGPVGGLQGARKAQQFLQAEQMQKKLADKKPSGKPNDVSDGGQP